MQTPLLFLSPPSAQEPGCERVQRGGWWSSFLPPAGSGPQFAGPAGGPGLWGKRCPSCWDGMVCTPWPGLHPARRLHGPSAPRTARGARFAGPGGASGRLPRGRPPPTPTCTPEPRLHLNKRALSSRPHLQRSTECTCWGRAVETLRVTEGETEASESRPASPALVELARCSPQAPVTC